MYVGLTLNSNRNYGAPVGCTVAGAASKNASTFSYSDVGPIAEELPALACASPERQGIGHW